MTHPVLSRKYSLSMLHPSTERSVRCIQDEIMQDDCSGQLLSGYPFYFMARLSDEQRAQIIAFLEATPLVTRSRRCFVTSGRPFWQIWRPKLVRARLCISWKEQAGTFVVVPVIPQL